MTKITGGDYRITYDPSTCTMTFRGVLRLYGTNSYVSFTELGRSHPHADKAHEAASAEGGYSSIMKLLIDVLNQSPKCITLDLRELQFLNSSGINLLSKFVIMMREQNTSELIIQGNQKLSWQKKVLRNLKVLMPRLILELE